MLEFVDQAACPEHTALHRARRAPDKMEDTFVITSFVSDARNTTFSSQGPSTGWNPVDCSLFVLDWRLWLRNRLRARTSEPMRALLLQAAPSVTPFEQPDEARLALRRAVQATLVGLVEMDCLLDRAEQLIARRVSTPAPAAQDLARGERKDEAGDLAA